MAMMSRAARRVGTTLDVMTTAQELTDLAVPAFADYATVDLAESVPIGGEPLERMRPGTRASRCSGARDSPPSTKVRRSPPSPWASRCSCLRNLPSCTCFTTASRIWSP